MHPDTFVIWAWCVLDMPLFILDCPSMILEGIILINLGKLETLSILPPGVAIDGVDFDCFLVTTGYPETKLVNG
jgi:hypothetical protein